MWAYVYTDSWIRCRVDLYAFFLRCFNILCYASGFYMLLFVVRCLWCARVHARVCVLFIGIVQRNWACLTWKSTIEIKSLLLLLLLFVVCPQLGGKVKSVAAAKPGEGIVKECQDANMVVVGSRGLGAVRRTLLGSVSDYLVHHCHCPVLVVKHPAHFHLHGERQESK